MPLLANACPHWGVHARQHCRPAIDPAIRAYPNLLYPCSMTIIREWAQTHATIVSWLAVVGVLIGTCYRVRGAVQRDEQRYQ
jgi:hypothetical protein